MRLSSSPIGEAGKSSSEPGGDRRPMYTSFGIRDRQIAGERVAGYDEDVVFLVVPDQSAFSR